MNGGCKEGGIDDPCKLPLAFIRYPQIQGSFGKPRYPTGSFLSNLDAKRRGGGKTPLRRFAATLELRRRSSQKAPVTRVAATSPDAGRHGPEPDWAQRLLQFVCKIDPAGLRLKNPVGYDRERKARTGNPKERAGRKTGEFPAGVNELVERSRHAFSGGQPGPQQVEEGKDNQDQAQKAKGKPPCNTLVGMTSHRIVSTPTGYPGVYASQPSRGCGS
jgi:hypothetical protein